MSRSADNCSGDSGRPDEGFTLIEVVVALGVTMVVMVALLPQLLVGIRGAALANDVTEAKGVVQGQLERMRNLPYHVAPSALRIDVLDLYFPDLGAPHTATFDCRTAGRFVEPSMDWKGYVHTSTDTRCPYEPATGSFYRNVESSNGYVIVTDTQFLDSVSRVTAASPLYRPIVKETSGPYNSGTVGSDAPVSPQIGVTVTAFYTNRGTLHPVSAYTQISDVPQSPTRIQGVANARALEVSGVTPGGQSVSLAAGRVEIAGTLSRSSLASVDPIAVSARLSTGDPVGWRLPTVRAPGTTTTTATSTTGGSLPAGDCTAAYVCWGAATLHSLTASADGGLPKAIGAPGYPVEARVTGSPGVSFRNTVAPDLPLFLPGLKLDSTRPLVNVDSTPEVTAAGCAASRGGLVTGRGYMQTTPTRVASCAETATARVSLFPTDFASGGVLRVTLVYALAQCSVDRATTPSTKTARTQYQVMVEVADPSSVTGYYQAPTITGDSTASTPLPDPLPGLLGRDVGGGHKLRDYVDSWALSTPSIFTSTAPSTPRATASLQGVIRLISQPVRNLPDAASGVDPSSAISLTLGAVSCDAEDAR